MKILIDNGHGVNTPGKCSPDKSLREYKWTREIASRIEAELNSRGYDALRIVQEQTDISLIERVRRVNDICKQYGTKNCVLISVHINAAGADNNWHDASGWSCWVAPNASSNSQMLAQLLYTEAEKYGLQGNRSVPRERYWIGNFTIIKRTNCPAVLTENLFQDNKNEVIYLLSEDGKKHITQLHVDGIINYIKQLTK